MARPKEKRRYLTRRQQEALDALRDYWEREGRGPSFEELGEVLGIGTSAVGSLIQALVRSGDVVDLGSRWKPAPRRRSR